MIGEEYRPRHRLIKGVPPSLSRTAGSLRNEHQLYPLAGVKVTGGPTAEREEQRSHHLFNFDFIVSVL